MSVSPPASPWWGISWAWVCGYSSLATLVVVFNIVLLASVVSNRYLHYSYNYVLVILSIRWILVTIIKELIIVIIVCRNICRVLLTLFILVLSKMVDSPQLLQSAHLISGNTSAEGLDLTQSASTPMMCEILSMADHFSMVILMYYLASLSLYLFCRKANPSNTITSDMTLRVREMIFTKGITNLCFSCMV